MSKQYLDSAGLDHYHKNLSGVFLDKATNESRIQELEDKTAAYEAQLADIIGLQLLLEELV